MSAKVHGKDVLPMGGEYTGAAVIQGILKFIEQYAPEMLDRASSAESRSPSAAAFASRYPSAPAVLLHGMS